MCGICGIVDLSAASVPERALLALRDGITHRGPDDAGIHVHEGVGLGARRLSVMDVSERGHMPMPNDDQSLWIVHNGEIYNFLALRAELEQAGHRFRSNGDTEVLLRAYQQWGDDCVLRIEGMFAFAVWDARRRRLFAARDRLGQKPFFYTQHGGQLVFCSEVHGLYRFTDVGPETIDPVALDAFLSFGATPPDRGFVTGIGALPPGHRLVFDANGLALSRYWEVDFTRKQRLSDDDAVDAVEETLSRAVAKRLRSDVPLGSFLSGGIDSGLVTAFAARQSDAPLSTFSVGFEGAAPEADERPLARLVAERYGTRHRELVVTPDHRAHLLRALWHVGEPFADVGVLPMFQISREARAHITVALSGDGGDESFAGYGNPVAAARAARFRSAVPATLRRVLAAAAALPGIGAQPAAARARRWLAQYVEQGVAAQLDAANSWNAHWRERLYTPEARARLGEDGAAALVARVLERAGALEDPELHLFADLHLRLPASYLTKVDIASSMVSLEVRSPFLDHEVVALAASLPFAQKLLGGRQKGLLRRLAERHLPRELTEAPKRGFAPDIGAWLRGDWADLVRELTDAPRTAAAGLVRADVVRAVASEHAQGRGDHAFRLWHFCCLELWWRLFVEGSLSKDDAI